MKTSQTKYYNNITLGEPLKLSRENVKGSYFK